jgi:chorismate mutase/prephenate dehydratase
MMKNNKWLHLRRKIDLIDRKILDLLDQRRRIAEKIIKMKIKSGLKVTDRKRENEIIKNLMKRTKNKILRKYVPSIYKIIFKISKEKYIKI